MKRITLSLISGSRVSIVTDEIERVTIGDAALGPSRISLTLPRDPEPRSWRIDEVMTLIAAGVNGLEPIDPDPLPSSSARLRVAAEDPEDTDGLTFTRE